MKRLSYLLPLMTAVILLLLLAPNAATAAQPCATIQDGSILTSYGDTIETGVDAWGYNYQARRFSGDYCDAYHGAAWCQPFVGIELAMQWNDAWLANTDCDGNQALDRHYGWPAYTGSGAWLTNHMRGTYELDGRPCNWTAFTKIAAPPASAVLVAGNWYTQEGKLIGPEIWGEFAIIMDDFNDACDATDGPPTKGARPGLGHW